MVYSAEPIPTTVLRSMFTSQWNQYSGSIPVPTFVEANDPEQSLRKNLRHGGSTDYVIMKIEPPGEEEIPIGTWIYANRRTRVILEVYTEVSRQRLQDLKQEIRRILHANMHNLTQYQRIQYLGFEEYVNEEMKVWAGEISLELLNSAVLMET